MAYRAELHDQVRAKDSSLEAFGMAAYLRAMEAPPS